MRTVIQRVSFAQVFISDALISQIEKGLLVYVAFEKEDQVNYIPKVIDKVLNLRIFPNDNGTFDQSVRDIGGDILLVSQFTLLADCSKGRRPSFVGSAPPELAKKLYDHMSEQLTLTGLKTQFGRFQENMQIVSRNDGPATLILDFPKE